MSNKTLEQRFWEKVDIREKDECWNWTGSTDHTGYGKILGVGGSRGKLVVAHRMSYELEFGPIPNGLRACHKCDNRLCCNPFHIFLGTARDNTQDMIRKGRNKPPYGSTNGKARLTPEQAQKIQSLFDCGKNIWQIIETFSWKHSKRNYMVVWYAAKRRNWKHILTSE